MGNEYDFGARILDSRIGRWLSIDPLQKKYADYSPFNFCLNSPIQSKDPDGKMVIFVNGYKTLQSFIVDNSPILRAARAFINAMTSESIDKTDNGNRWEGLDDKFMERIKDNNAVYADGSSAMESTANERMEEGREAGRVLLAKVNSGEIELASGETIKIVAHSQGCAYAAGMAEVLIANKKNVEVIYNIAPKQPDDFCSPEGVWRTVHYSCPTDLIAPQGMESPCKNNEFRDDVAKEKAKLINGNGHTQGCYHDTNSSSPNNDKCGIFTIPSGEEGAVEESKGVPYSNKDQ